MSISGAELQQIIRRCIKRSLCLQKKRKRITMTLCFQRGHVEVNQKWNCICLK